MDDTFRRLGELLVSTGPIGVLVAAVLVAAALVVIVYAQISGLFAERRAASQQGEFQDRLLKSLEALQDSETRLRTENSELREEIARVHAVQELMRIQQRRAIDLMRRVVNGSLAAADLPIDEIEKATT